jgi:membrane-bound lytic murein transglycosylase D
MYIYEYHKEHGIVPNRAVIKHFATDTIMVKREITFKQISDLIDIPVSQLQLLNPAYKRDVVPFIEGENHYLRMPNDKVAIYTSNEDKIYAYVNHEASKRERTYESRYASKVNEAEDGHIVTKTSFYKIKRGDSLSEIANKYGVSLAELKKWNRIKGTYAPRGKMLKIYSYDNVAVNPKDIETNQVAEVKKEPTADEEKAVVAETKFKEEVEVSFVTKIKKYKVKRGDNLSSIANKYGVTVADIKEWNGLKKTSVASGKVLKIKTLEKVASKVKREIRTDKKAIENKNETFAANEKATKAEKETPLTESKSTEFYVVQKGDNLTAIAKKYSVSVEDLKKWNQLSNGNITLGLQLKLTKDSETSNSNTEVASKTEYKTQEYVVLKGDNLGNIAKKYKVTTDDLKSWNNLSDNNIQLGSSLIVAKTEVVVAEKAAKKEKLASKNKAKEEHYYVQKGDSLYKIAKKHPGITVSDIKKWNGISNEDLKPGMKLKISG